MELHFFAIPALDPQTAEDQLNRFLSSSPVAGVDRQFVADGANSFWSVCVQLAAAGPAAEKPRKRGSVDYREVLSPEVFARYARLRSLRNRLAEQQGVPPYAIFSNEQLAQIAALEPPTRTALAAIEGIGEKRLAQYADAFLAELEQADAHCSGN